MIRSIVYKNNADFTKQEKGTQIELRVNKSNYLEI